MYKAFTKRFNLENIIVAGASQGGRIVIERSLQSGFENSLGFISVIPAIQDIKHFEILVKENNHKKLKGCIIAGNKDSFFAKTMELKQLFEEYEVDCKFIIVEGLGHFFPDNFIDLLEIAVEFVKD